MSRAPIADAAAERDLLAAALMLPEALDLLADTLAPSDFSAPHQQRLYAAVLGVRRSGQPVDTLSVRAALGAADSVALALVDDLASELVVTRDDALLDRARRLRDLASVRATVEACRRLVAESEDGIEDARDFLARAERSVAAAAELRDIREPTLMADGLEQKIAAWNRGERIAGNPTGFRQIDYYTGGLVPGLMTIVAGRPGMGKTSFGLALALGCSRATSMPALFCSLEMPMGQLIERVVSAEGGIESTRLRDLRPSSDDMRTVIGTHATLMQRPVYVDDEPVQSVHDIGLQARRLQRRHGGLCCVVVDYLQMVHAPSNRSREEEVAGVARGLVRMAKQLNVPVLALAAMNRDGEKSGDKRPTMAMLRESGGIESDAAHVLLLYRAEVYLKDKTPAEERGICEVIIDKNRIGPTGIVRMGFQSQYTRFVALEPRDYA